MAQRILVLDDEENYVEMLKLLLEEHNFLVDSETSPERALHRLEEIGYDLIISDYKMPVMDGADFLRKAREIGPDLPFIIISGLMNTPELVKVANIGVTLVLEKPIDIENFLEHVQRFVKPLSKEEFEKHTLKGEAAHGHSVSAAGRLFVKAYPEKLEYVSDLSSSQQFFLQDVWDSMQEQDHVFIKIPPGAEVELMLREFAHWMSEQPSRSVLIDLATHQGNFKDLLVKLSEDTAYAHCLVGFVRFPEATPALQQALVNALHDTPERLSHIYFIEDYLLRQEQPAIQQELIDLIHLSLCEMPPLNDRLADMAAYVRRYLPRIAQAERRPEKAGLAGDAKDFLLAHDWPGNFAELIRLLRTAVLLGGKGPLSKQDLETAARRLGIPAAKPVAVAGVEEAMRQRQQILLKEVLGDNQAGLPDIWLSLQTNIDAARAGDSLDTLPLLYPELLEKT